MTFKQITIAVAAAMLSAGAYAGGGEHGKQQPRAESGNGAMTQSQSGQQNAGSQGGQQQAQAQSPELVRQAQQALKDKGIDAGPVDGQWGPLTRQGVKQFQEQNQIQATGQLDQQTLASLGIEQGASASTGSSARASEPGASSGSSSSGSNGSAGASASGNGSAAPGSSAESPKAPADAAAGSPGTSSQKY
jgi:hypothetical protein